MSQVLTGRRQASTQAGIALPVVLPWLLMAIAAGTGAAAWWQHQRASDAWATERDQLTEHRAAARAEVAQLRGRLDDLSEVQSKLDALSDKLRHQRDAASALRDHIKEIGAVPERLKTAQRRVAELESAAAAEQTARAARERVQQDRLQRLQAHLTELQRDHLRVRDAQLTAELALRRGEQRIADADSRVAKAEQQIAAAQAHATAAQGQHSKLQQHTDTLFAESQRLSEQGDELARRLDTALAERDAARQQVEELQQHLSELSTELAETRRAQRAYSAELDDTRHRLQQASETAGQLDARLAELASRRETDRARFSALRKRLEDQLGERGVTIETLRNRLTVITLQNDVLFPSGSAELTGTARRALDEIAGALREYPQRLIAIEGHTDSVPLRPGRAYPTNWELSAARAASAVRFLAGHDGIAPERLHVIGYGKYRPVSDNDSATGRKRNRRIEIRLLPEEGWLARRAAAERQANAQ